MALDPNDPLIPLPWQMDQIRAYRAQKAIEAEQDRMKMEERALDLAAKRRKQEMESPSGRATTAAEVAAKIEEMNQEEKGIPIGKDIGKQMLKAGGPSILEATKMQGKMDVESRAREAYKNALSEYLVRESLTPSAKVDVGGMTATVPFQSAGEKMSQAYKQQYQSMVPVVAEKYIAEGYDRDSAIRKASEDVGSTLIKKNFNGEIPIYGIDGQTVMQFLPQKEAIKMFQDPKTPKFIANQLEQYFGPKGQSAARDWVKSRIGR